MPVRAGRLRHRVTIQTRSQSVNEYGEPSNSWSELDQVWAAIEPINGDERVEMQSSARQGHTSHRVTVRYLANVDATDRVLFGSRVLEIVSVLNFDEKDEFLTLLCREKT